MKIKEDSGTMQESWYVCIKLGRNRQSSQDEHQDYAGFSN